MTNDIPWVAYVGPFRFPWGQAGSRRVYGIARAIEECGYKVRVGSGQYQRPGFAVNLGRHESDEIDYVSLSEMPAPDASLFIKLWKTFFLAGTRTVEWLNSQPVRPTFVIVYGAGAPFMHRVSRWCYMHNVPLVADVVEWYDGSHMLGGYFGPFHVSAKLAFHYYFPKCAGVITISRYLDAHFKSRVSSTVRVPPVVDFREFRFNTPVPARKNGYINLVYAGTPGKKDLLATIIKAMHLADPQERIFNLDVVGVNRSQVIKLMDGVQLSDSVRVHGVIQQENVRKILANADFSVLVREPKRFANAGFSTKFVESFAVGVPVIGNLTSDMELYMRDGINSIVCNGWTVDAVADALNRAARLSGASIADLKLCARDEAEKAFNYQQYVPRLSEFLGKLAK